MSVSYNSRDTLPNMVQAVVENTRFPRNAVWYMLLQNFSDEACQTVVQLCKDKIELVLIRFAKNIGLSKAMTYLNEQCKNFEFVISIEDDWKLLATHIPSKDWLLLGLRFLQHYTDVSAIFLRTYSTEKEAWQYGHLRSIPFTCHKHAGNYDYKRKMEGSERIVFEGVTFAHIPTMMFTFNPMIMRNKDFHKHVYPLDVFDLDSKAAGSNANWGHTEALAAERTRDLKIFWMKDGIMAHMEDMILCPM